MNTPETTQLFKPVKKPFDLGIYSFHRTIHGSVCQDDGKLTQGDTVGVLHPLQNVDPHNVYCFGVSRGNGYTHTLVRKNLRFKRVVTLTYDHTQLMDAVQELHAKLNAALEYLTKEAKQLEIAA